MNSTLLSIIASQIYLLNFIGTVSLALVSADECCPCPDVLIVVVERILVQGQPPPPGLLQHPVGLVDGEVHPPVLGPGVGVTITSQPRLSGLEAALDTGQPGLVTRQ